MTCGIYKITENSTGKCYIGQSRKIESRWKKHHKRFPVNDFTYEVIMECEVEQLNFWEIACIASERTAEFGFNVTVGGNAYGWKNPEETKRKLSIAAKNRPKRPSNFKGKKHSESSKSKLSLALKGNKNGIGNKSRGKHKMNDIDNNNGPNLGQPLSKPKPLVVQDKLKTVNKS
jgi:group I intron endonuclease